VWKTNLSGLAVRGNAEEWGGDAEELRGGAEDLGGDLGVR
jgi:hypothetical protein